MCPYRNEAEIGARQKAGRIGGIGPVGRELGVVCYLDDQFRIRIYKCSPLLRNSFP